MSTTIYSSFPEALAAAVNQGAVQIVKTGSPHNYMVYRPSQKFDGSIASALIWKRAFCEPDQWALAPWLLDYGGVANSTKPITANTFTWEEKE